MPTFPFNESSRFSDYYNRVVDGDQVEALLFRAGKPLQSGELNELQTLMLRRFASVSQAVFKDGSVVDGSEIFVLEDDEDGNIELKEGRIYLQGMVYSVPGTKLDISFLKKVQVGIRLRYIEIDEVDDPSLLDQAAGRNNFAVGGAGRVKSELHWGWRAADGTQDSRGSWSFFPIYEVDHGVIIIKTPPAVADPAKELIARYDRESHGSYVVRGLRPSYVSANSGNYIFDLSEGVANIFGFKLDRTVATRVTWAQDFSTANSNNEPHTYTEDGDGKCRIKVNRPPVATTGEIIGTKQKSVTAVRGVSSGGSDQLPDSSVVAVVAVSQGLTNYVAGRDYTVSGDTISWAPNGVGAIEPAPGSSYTVVYQYTTTLTKLPESTDTTIVLSGCVPGSVVFIDYDYKLPRVDVMAMNRDGEIVRLKGVSQLRNPAPPVCSPDQIELAQVYYDWMHAPVVSQTAIRAIPMNEIEDMRRNIGDLFQLIAIERLKTNIAVTDPSSKLGVFVDAFFDDDLRDQGIEQNAAIALGKGILMLSNVPDTAEPSNTSALRAHQLLPFSLEVILQQNARSESMLINPYAAFDILPSPVYLSPSSDRWVHWIYTWTSPATMTVELPTSEAGGLLVQITRSVQTRVVATFVRDAQFIRQRLVGVTAYGFLPGEVVQAMTFDGIDLAV